MWLACSTLASWEHTLGVFLNARKCTLHGVLQPRGDNQLTPQTCLHPFFCIHISLGCSVDYVGSVTCIPVSSQPESQATNLTIFLRLPRLSAASHAMMGYDGQMGSLDGPSYFSF